MKLIKLLFKIVFFGILLLAVFCIGYYFAVTNKANLSPEKLVLCEKNVTVYDYTGTETKSLSSAIKGQTARIQNTPRHIAQAFIDTEDKRFFTHHGFDTRRIIKACLVNLRTKSFHEGASTISQQLIKNTHLTQDKTVKRKLCEWKLTRLLEKNYDKREILERYLNVIYFGHDCFGIQSASAFYFGKDPKDLDVADAAVLAGLVKSPNNYSPFKNPLACQKRKETVLGLMRKNGSISDTEYRDAIKKPLPVSPSVHKKNFSYAHFVFDELSTLSEIYRFRIGGKIEIYTYYDRAMQTALENVANSHTQTDKTLLISDVKTGGFSACVSTVGNIRRLPGSLLKPLFVYAPAMEENVLSPATPLLDEPVNYNGYKPKNFNGQYQGYVSARESLAQSLNIPAVKTLETLGLARVNEYATQMNLTLEKDDLSLALALGGMKNGYTLPQLVSAYATFPKMGTYTENRFISKIKINDVTVYQHKSRPRRVFSEDTSALMTDMLQTTAQTGTAKKLRTLPFPVAAKTGTTGTANGNTDAYAVSYTPQNVIGVWLGNSKGGFIDCTGGGEPCNLISQAHLALRSIQEKRGNVQEKFQLPCNIVRVDLDKTIYYDTHTLCLADEYAPKEYRISELFKKQCVPSKKSDFFSNPAIIQPVLQYSQGKVTICFDERSPRFYHYRIERYDYATHNTLYCGAFTQTFIDDSVENGKVYRYTVTPIYKGKSGKTLTLPTVYTTQKESILDKPWWNY